MLKDAALHTLDLLLHSGQYGFTLKDATAYNVQFWDVARFLLIFSPSRNMFLAHHGQVIRSFANSFYFPWL